MSLYLYELVAASSARAQIDDLLNSFGAAARAAGAEVIESQVTGPRDRVFVVVEAEQELAGSIRAEQLDEVAELSGPHQVRLVGADLAEVKAARPEAGYLVEWDFPADLDMETYLANKEAKAPKYAEVPEVTFLRTYVREDMEKCLCFYDAPDEDVVRKAREAVSTPIDRLHELDHR